VISANPVSGDCGVLAPLLTATRTRKSCAGPLPADRDATLASLQFEIDGVVSDMREVLPTEATTDRIVHPKNACTRLRQQRDR
jgi:hypothetical protein